MEFKFLKPDQWNQDLKHLNKLKNTIILVCTILIIFSVLLLVSSYRDIEQHRSSENLLLHMEDARDRLNALKLTLIKEEKISDEEWTRLFEISQGFISDINKLITDNPGVTNFIQIKDTFELFTSSINSEIRLLDQGRYSEARKTDSLTEIHFNNLTYLLEPAYVFYKDTGQQVLREAKLKGLLVFGIDLLVFILAGMQYHHCLRAAQREAFMRNILDAIQDGILVIDKDFTIQRVNHMMNSWYQKTLPLEGKKCYQELQNLLEPCDSCPALRTIKHGLPQIETKQLTMSDGSRGWIEVHSFPLFDESGKVTGVVEYIRNVTDRKKVEELLFESMQQYRVTFDYAAVGIVHIGLHGKLLKVNNKFCKLVGYSARELTGMTIADIIHPDDWTANTAFMQCLFKNDSGISSIEKRYLTKSKETVWVNVTGSLLRDSSGEFKYLIAVVDDITKRKETEWTLQKEKDAAEEASSAKSLILANVMGEIRAPLNKITGVAELALATDLTGEQREYLETLLTSSNYLLRVVNGIIDYREESLSFIDDAAAAKEGE